MSKRMRSLITLGLLMPLASCLTVSISLPREAQVRGSAPSAARGASTLARSPQPADVKWAAAHNFRVTRGVYGEKSDLTKAISDEFGPDYRLADWNDILKYTDHIEEWADAIGLREGEEHSLLVSRNERRFWNGPRHYYISRFNGDKPPHYLAHDSIGKHYICLGSWYGIEYRVLAVRKPRAKHL